MSLILAASLISNIFRLTICITYRKNQSAWIQLLCPSLINRFIRSLFHFHLAWPISLHHCIVFCLCQRDDGSMSLMVRIKVEIIVCCLDPFCICNIGSIERYIADSAKVICQESVCLNFLSVHFFPVILIVCK